MFPKIWKGVFCIFKHPKSTKWMWFENQRTLSDFNSLTVKTRISLKQQTKTIHTPTNNNNTHHPFTTINHPNFKKNDVDFYTHNTKKSQTHLLTEQTTFNLGHTVDGRNPAPVEVGSSSQYFQSFPKTSKRCLFGISINHLGSIETFTISTGERRISKNHPPVIHRSLAAVVRCCSVPATVPLHSSLDVSRPQPSLDGAVPRTAPGFRVGRLAGKTTGFFHTPPPKKNGGFINMFYPPQKIWFLRVIGIRMDRILHFPPPHWTLNPALGILTEKTTVTIIQSCKLGL